MPDFLEVVISNFCIPAIGKKLLRVFGYAGTVRRKSNWGYGPVEGKLTIQIFKDKISTIERNLFTTDGVE
jgi:hypothetical protein